MKRGLETVSFPCGFKNVFKRPRRRRREGGCGAVHCLELRALRVLGI